MAAAAAGSAVLRGRDLRDPTANVHELVVLAVQRLDDLRIAEAHRVNQALAGAAELNRMAAEYEEKLRVAEAKRIDANRAADMQAVTVANERTIVQAATLASQVQASAETLRALVATTADNAAKHLSSLTEEITNRLSALEKAQYESKGSGTGMRDMWAWVFAGAMALVSIASVVYNMTRK